MFESVLPTLDILKSKLRIFITCFIWIKQLQDQNQYQRSHFYANVICNSTKGGVFLKVKVKSENRPLFLTEYCDLNFPRTISFRKHFQRSALSVGNCLFKLWRAVKKVVDFLNSTLYYRITPPLIVNMQRDGRKKKQ